MHSAYIILFIFNIITMFKTNKFYYRNTEFLAHIGLLEKQIKYNAKTKAITPLISYCMVRNKICLDFMINYIL